MGASDDAGTLDCSEIVLRGLRERHARPPFPPRAACRPEACLLGEADLDRGRLRDEYLSIYRESLIDSYEALYETHLPISRALASLHCGRARTLGLDAREEGEPGNEAHAGIHGLPHPEDGPAEADAAEELALALALVARICHRRGG